MLKNYLQSKTDSLIIADAYKITNEAFKKNNQYDSVGFSKFLKIKKIKKGFLNNTDSRVIRDFDSVFNGINFFKKLDYLIGSIVVIDGGFN
tara:strand:+ start:321 stop:593 length:273 start_codon:yes stop_codon:yes gene_type:complete